MSHTHTEQMSSVFCCDCCDLCCCYGRCCNCDTLNAAVSAFSPRRRLFRFRSHCCCRCCCCCFCAPRQCHRRLLWLGCHGKQSIVTPKRTKQNDTNAFTSAHELIARKLNLTACRQCMLFFFYVVRRFSFYVALREL